jgi:hypothetical protein
MSQPRPARLRHTCSTCLKASSVQAVHKLHSHWTTSSIFTCPTQQLTMISSSGGSCACSAIAVYTVQANVIHRATRSTMRRCSQWPWIFSPSRLQLLDASAYSLQVRRPSLTVEIASPPRHSKHCKCSSTNIGRHTIWFACGCRGSTI